jgi:alkanesulfonate monooxygenase SsuD/methylene tetrahydromethanopterin reductase-like flavin-dependent oxidoreductase (luciferase family)
MYKPRGLRITGRLADGWIPSFGYAPPDVVGGLRDEVIRAAREAGRDPSAVRCIYNVTVRVDERATASPMVVGGSPANVAERLVELRRIGFDGFNLIPTGPGLGEQIERIGGEVLPALRGLLL